MVSNESPPLTGLSDWNDCWSDTSASSSCGSSDAPDEEGDCDSSEVEEAGHACLSPSDLHDNSGRVKYRAKWDAGTNCGVFFLIFILISAFALFNAVLRHSFASF